jgi:hypothetical protein
VSYRVREPIVAPTAAPTAPGRPGWLRQLGVVTAVAVATTLLGAPAGWLWAALAPRVEVIKHADGFAYAEPEPEQAIAADGWFALVGLVAGISLAVLAWVLLRRYRGVAMLVGLIVGSLAGAALAAWVGYRIGSAGFNQIKESALVGARLEAPLRLRMTGMPGVLWPIRPTGVLAVQAWAAAAMYTFTVLFAADPDLTGEPGEPTLLDPRDEG